MSTSKALEILEDEYQEWLATDNHLKEGLPVPFESIAALKGRIVRRIEKKCRTLGLGERCGCGDCEIEPSDPAPMQEMHCEYCGNIYYDLSRWCLDCRVSLKDEVGE